VAADRVSRPFRDAYGYFAGLVHAKSQNNRLRREVDQLRQQASQNAAAASENTDLLKKLHFVNSRSFPRGFGYVGTRVVAQPPNAYEQQIVIGAGTNSGIRQNDPVVTDAGLVGTVTKAFASESLVALLTDDTTWVSALDVKTRAVGIVKAGGSFEHVSKDQQVNSGDELVTAGWKSGTLSSIYPPGIPIGRVTSVGQNDVALYKSVQLQPYANVKTLSSVLVLIPKNGR
jgi:rod shape-determining protein MreC